MFKGNLHVYWSILHHFHGSMEIAIQWIASRLPKDFFYRWRFLGGGGVTQYDVNSRDVMNSNNELRDVTHRIVWRYMTWHDVMWRDMTLYDETGLWRDMTPWYVTRHDAICRDMTLCDVTWRYVTWYDVIWRDMTLNHVTWCSITCVTLYDAARCSMMWYEATWRWKIAW